MIMVSTILIISPRCSSIVLHSKSYVLTTICRTATDRRPQQENNGVFELAYGIAHDGGGVLMCKWAPEEFDGEVEEACMRQGRGVGADRGEEALGLLAGVFGDGSLRCVHVEFC